MPYQADDESIHDGEPIELYEFSGPSASYVYRFTSADEDQDYLGNTYTSVPLLRTEVALVAGGDGEEINVEMPIKLPSGAVNPLLAEFAWKRPPRRTLGVIVYRRHGTAGAVEQYWEGRCTGFHPAGSELVNARSPSLLNDALQAAFPGKSYTPQCTNRLGDEICGQGIDLETMKVNTTISAISGFDVTIASVGGKPANYFTNGVIVRLSDGERRDIRLQAGSTGVLTLLDTFVELATTNPVDVYPGCSHVLTGADGCFEKFDNTINYVGAPHMSGRKIVSFGLWLV